MQETWHVFAREDLHYFAPLVFSCTEILRLVQLTIVPRRLPKT